WNHPASYVGIPTALEDIGLLLDQWSEAQFQWTPYKDSTIWAVISDEFFQNLNIWHVKVPLVNYATVETHQTDRVLHQFGFQQPILKALEVLDKEHKIDLRERRGPLNPSRRDDGTGPSTAPTQSPGPTPQPTTPTA
ncbi:hypothetical protein Gogos_020456, partial [Gossypium gossypioides]|nr:hypothetical protein [Gossypium gossypioides]